MLGKHVVDFSMTGNGLFSSIRRIDVNVVITTVSMQYAAFAFKFPDQFATFHRAISFV